MTTMTSADLRRPLFEIYAAGTWVLGTVGIVGCALFLSSPSFALAIAAVTASIAFRRWRTGVALLRRKLALVIGKVEFIPLHNLMSASRAAGDALYLGQGFVIRARHVSAWYELRNLDMVELMQPLWLLQRVSPWVVGHAVTAEMLQKSNAWIDAVEDEAHKVPILQSMKEVAGHVVVTGTTGAGKTTLCICYAIQRMLKGHVVVVIDPKGTPELQHAMRYLAAQLERPYVEIDPAKPHRSSRFNLLGNFNRSTEIPSRVLAIESSKASDFMAFGWVFMSRLVAAMQVASVSVTLSELRRRILAGPDLGTADLLDICIHRWLEAHAGSPACAAHARSPLSALIGDYRARCDLGVPSSPVIDGLLATHSHDRAHYSKVSFNINPLLDKLTASGLDALFSPDTDDVTSDAPVWSPRAMAERRAVVYVRTDSLSDAEVGSAIGTMLLSNIVAYAGERYNTSKAGEYGTRVSVICDEAAETINVPAIQLMNKGRQAELDTLLLTQDIADFEYKLASESLCNMVLGNSNTLISFRVTSERTQRYVQNRLGTCEIERIGFSANASLKSDDGFLDYSATFGQKTQQQEAEVIPGALLSRLPDLHYILCTPAGTPYKGVVPIVQLPHATPA